MKTLHEWILLHGYTPVSMLSPSERLAIAPQMVTMGELVEESLAEAAARGLPPLVLRAEWVELDPVPDDAVPLSTMASFSLAPDRD